MNALLPAPLFITIVAEHYVFAVIIILLLVIILILMWSGKKRRHLLKHQQDELSIRDMTLEKLAKENDWLLTEVHHRVKNNLQIVTSLLHSQSAYLKDNAAINAIMESQHRIQAMSLIHKKLYEKDNISTVFMPEYINELVSYLMDSFKKDREIVCKLHVDNIRLQIIHAVPVGLILNEILTNALKFAFPNAEQEQDCISIKFYNVSTAELCLEVKDNGCGLPEGFSLNNKTSFGMLLMEGLTAELEGVFSIENREGTCITMCFRNSVS